MGLVGVCVETFPPDGLLGRGRSKAQGNRDNRDARQGKALNSVVWKDSHPTYWLSGGVECGYEPQAKNASSRLILTPQRGQTALANIIW